MIPLNRPGASNPAYTLQQELNEWLVLRTCRGKPLPTRLRPVAKIEFQVQNQVSMDLDITSNPEILFDHSVSVDRLTLLGHRLGDHVSQLPLHLASYATCHEPENETLIYTAGRVYFVRNAARVEFPLRDRVALAASGDGWITFPTGYRFRISEGIIAEIGVHGGVLDHFASVSKQEIPKRFGRPDQVVKVEELGEPLRTQYVIEHRKMRLSYLDSDGRLERINIGPRSDVRQFDDFPRVPRL